MTIKQSSSFNDIDTALVSDTHIFSGTIFLLYGFDMGDDFHLEKIDQSQQLNVVPKALPSYLKSYHKPLTISLPTTPNSTNGIRCMYGNIHHFGTVSLVYQVPFSGTLTHLRDKLNDLDNQCQKQSISDAHTIFKKIKPFTVQPTFYHQSNSYLVIHITPQPETVPTTLLRSKYGSLIASILRFEKETISPFQVFDILESATGYYREEMVIIDTEAAFMYDKEPEELLGFFEFAMIQQLELRYFDKILDQKLDAVYHRTLQKPSLRNCLPFSSLIKDPIGELSNLKVDISVITERLDNSIKTGGEAYYSEIYDLLVEKLAIKTWQQSIAKKLEIIRDVRTIHQNIIDAIREDMLSVLIIILIFIELMVGIIR